MNTHTKTHEEKLFELRDASAELKLRRETEFAGIDEAIATHRPAEMESRRRAEAHVAGVVAAIIAAEPSIEFGEREGPCIVEYRDWWERGWPMRRAFSCLGCRWHERDPEYRSSLCVHPVFLAKYDSPQSIAHNHWWRQEMAAVHAFSCPVLRRAGVAAHCPLPAPDEMPGRERSKVYRRWFPSEKAEIFSIPQRLPYWLKDAYERGESVDRQCPTPQ